MQTGSALAASGTSSTLQSSGSSLVCSCEQVENFPLTGNVICTHWPISISSRLFHDYAFWSGLSVFPSKEPPGESHKVLSNVRGGRLGLSEISLVTGTRPDLNFCFCQDRNIKGPWENSLPTSDPCLRNKQLNHWHFLVDLRISPTASLPNHCSTGTSVFHPCSHFTGKRNRTHVFYRKAYCKAQVAKRFRLDI